jgi:hypothetical protein
VVAPLLAHASQKIDRPHEFMGLYAAATGKAKAFFPAECLSDTGAKNYDALLPSRGNFV